MRFKLEALLSVLTSFAAVAYALGWLKSFYFYRTLGVNLDLAGLSSQDYLFESWFVIENLVFFVILWWIVLKAPTWWAIWLGVAYSLIPIAAHYAFARPEWPVAAVLISSRHTLLKLIPFAFLALRYSFGGRTVRTALRSSAWPYSSGALGLCVAIALAWGVSSAKHFGSFDALQYLASPEQYFSAVRLRGSAELAGWDESRLLYFLRKTDSSYLMLDLAQLPDKRHIGLVVVPLDHVRWIEGSTGHQVQLGNRWF